MTLAASIKAAGGSRAEWLISARAGDLAANCSQ